LVLQTSYESELLQVAHAVMDSSRITQITVFMIPVPVPKGSNLPTAGRIIPDAVVELPQGSSQAPVTL
jgi:hypothetical protein